ncbi:SURF1 family protein [Aurantimonas sp. Leaf443]|uniref:SURF1 family protein n=1 Tax=Aurantimonas sp. Leaf443 TaxID=1736378 RepID=UPI0007008DCA|nr:SURF1 family protein [Aurantimonas sp. Leaf443]KQT87144.1 Surfeit locus 1 family protein [Aurantimonas sp. Leaf443]
MSPPGGAPPPGPPARQVPRRRGGAARAALGLAALLVLGVLLALGTWQVQRLAWKEDLIARVDARLAAAPVEAPGPQAWGAISAAADEYRRVALAGTFLHERETLVQALTERGAGFWVLTPLRRADGTLVIVNRGFVPEQARDRHTRAGGEIAGPTRVEGLLRLTEPGGGFLRANDPAGGRWYSRDISAIAAATLPGERVAPYFVDAGPAPNPGGLPVGGLTVISFRNHHLVYALTWYGLALLLVGGLAYAFREERRQGRAR